MERQFPCPPQLKLIYSLLKPRLPRWDELAEPIPSGTEEEFDTLDKPSRNLGKEEVSTNKVYPEHWLKYSEKGNQKSRYIPKKKVKKVQEMNEQKASVTDIIAFLENKDY